MCVAYSDAHDGAILLNIQRRFDNNLIYVCACTEKQQKSMFYEMQQSLLTNFPLFGVKIAIPFTFCSLSLSLSISLFHFPFFKKTYIGNLLVATNPFQPFNIYGTEEVERYRGQPLGKLPP